MTNTNEITQGELYAAAHKQKEKERVLAIVKLVEHDTEIPCGFHSLGAIGDVYPELPENVLECYRTWIFKWYDDSFRIAMHDSGNGHCRFMCEGTEEKLIEYLTSKGKEYK